jgi:hypothetical protein
VVGHDVGDWHGKLSYDASVVKDEANGFLVVSADAGEQGIN